mgnify:CR=1 FL=1
MRLTFFGRLRDAIGSAELDRSIPTTVADSESLRVWIGAEFPDLLDPKIRIALDDVLANGAMPVAGAKEAAFLPPVSGG